MIEPLRVSVEIDCPRAHAFHVWTAQIGRWWPVSHSVSTAPGLTVVLEGRPGGRIFERAPDGVEHDWGEITVWEPPVRLVPAAPATINRCVSTVYVENVV